MNIRRQSMIEVFVESIRVNSTNHKRVVMLKEKNRPRYLPIWIGHYEADALSIVLQSVVTTRPLTHDSWAGTAELLGWKWVQALLTGLQDETFYAKLVL